MNTDRHGLRKSFYLGLTFFVGGLNQALKTYANMHARLPSRILSVSICVHLWLSSMPEMAIASENHRDAALVGGGDYFFIAHTTAGLNYGNRAGIHHHV